MITITREFTKEQLIEHIKGRKEFSDECAADSTLHPERREYYELTAEALRIALASLEVERGMIRRFDLDMSDCDSCGQDCGADMVEDLDGEYVLWDEVLPHLYRHDEYTAPPAQVYDEDLLNMAASAIDDLLSNKDRSGAGVWADIPAKLRRAAMLQGSDERHVVRSEHAEWSQSTFGDVGPVGPLKHLSKEALEAAAEPGDLSEWADMQFLLWDAQRRAGITDEQITLAMIKKLAVNKARTWPEPKDGEPRLHIKAAPQQEVKQ